MTDKIKITIAEYTITLPMIPFARINEIRKTMSIFKDYKEKHLLVVDAEKECEAFLWENRKLSIWHCQSDHPQLVSIFKELECAYILWLQEIAKEIGISQENGINLKQKNIYEITYDIERQLALLQTIDFYVNHDHLCIAKESPQ